MLTAAKRLIKRALGYKPLPESLGIHTAIDAVRVPRLPYCPAYEGDLIYSLIQKGGAKTCLELGFHTGSTALYLLAAVAHRQGHVTSICLDDDDEVARGMGLLESQDYADNHRLIRENSNRAVPELFLSGDQFDFVFIDGWKTFDHLAFEIYFINQMLVTGGIVTFDDSHMPSVRKAIRLLTRYYGYEEIDYSAHNQGLRLRLYLLLTRRTVYRPYRAFTKTQDTKDQLPFQDWHFHRSI